MGMQRRKALIAGVALIGGGMLGVKVFAQAAPRVIPVVARKFVFIPAQIALKKGEAVTIELTSPEVVMGFPGAGGAGHVHARQGRHLHFPLRHLLWRRARGDERHARRYVAFASGPASAIAFR